MGSRLPIEVVEPTPEAMTALWEALCEDPLIADLPYKVETNERGQLLMSPTSTPHSLWQAFTTRELFAATDAAGIAGKVLTEAAVLTPQGIKVPDVAWISDAAWQARSNQALLMLAPDICVEVLSPSNSLEEMRLKTILYLACGAREVWLLAPSGQMRFFDARGEQSRSLILPGFAAQVGPP